MSKEKTEYRFSVHAAPAVINQVIQNYLAANQYVQMPKPNANYYFFNDPWMKGKRSIEYYIHGTEVIVLAYMGTFEKPRGLEGFVGAIPKKSFRDDLEPLFVELHRIDMMGMAPQQGMPMQGMPYGYGMPMQGMPYGYGMPMQQAPVKDVNVSPASFQPFQADVNPLVQQENIDLIMDVPLEVTVELGRVSKSIKDILDFAPGTIVELNKIAGEAVDVLVNGKYVAKGEVVVIEENFGVRITEIIK